MTHFDDSPHDLPPDHEADVSFQEADALDARLNEISQRQGRATAWFRRGLQRRSRIRETADVPGFAQAFHQRVDETEAADAGFTGLDPTLWEQIMMSTTSPGLTPGRPTVSANPSAKPQAARKSARPTSPRPFLTSFTNATLAIIVLLMSFGAWRIYDGGRPTSPPTPDQPHSLAFQPESTPETIAAVPDDISTPEPAFACDFTSDIPILLEVNESTVDATVVLLTRSGDVVLSCPEQSAPIVLATNQGQVAPTEWPGVVMTQAMNYEVGVTPVTYINLLTGEQVEIVPTYSQPTTMAWTGGRSQWAVQDSGTEQGGNLTLVNLRSFEVGQLANYFPDGSYPPQFGTISSTNASGVLAVGLCYQNQGLGTCPLQIRQEAPGAVLILDGSLDDTHWIDVPDDLTDIQEMVLSPDGKFLALRSTSGMDASSESMTTIFSLIRTDTGVEVGRSDVSHAMPDMRWAMDGEVLVFLDDAGVSFVRTGTGEIARLLETDAELQDLRSTHDPTTVLVTSVQVEDLMKEPPTLVNHRQLVLSLRTGSVVIVDGMKLSLSSYPEEQTAQVQVVADESLVGFGPHTFRLVDAVTGLELGTLEEVEFAAVSPEGQPLLDMGQVVTTPNGASVVMSFSPTHTYLIRMASELEVVHLTSPDANIMTALSMTLSPDGKWLSAQPKGQNEAQFRYLIDLTDPDSGWHAIPDDYPETGVRNIFFVPGSGD